MVGAATQTVSPGGPAALRQASPHSRGAPARAPAGGFHGRRHGARRPSPLQEVFGPDLRQAIPSIGDLTAGVLAAINTITHQQMRWCVSYWPEAVGADFARLCAPRRLEARVGAPGLVLEVEVRSSVARFQLQARGKELARRLQAASGGEIRAVRLVVGGRS